MDINKNAEKKEVLDPGKHKHALADFLEMDRSEILVCTTRINNIATFQAKEIIYLVGTREEVQAGIRGYFEHNLAELDSEFIGRVGRLSDMDALLVVRLCELLIEEKDIWILNRTLLHIVGKCGDIRSLIDAAMDEVDSGEFLAMDSKEHSFGDFLIYKFREGKCSDFEILERT